DRPDRRAGGGAESSGADGTAARRRAASRQRKQNDRKDRPTRIARHFLSPWRHAMAADVQNTGYCAKFHTARVFDGGLIRALDDFDSSLPVPGKRRYQLVAGIAIQVRYFTVPRGTHSAYNRLTRDRTKAQLRQVAEDHLRDQNGGAVTRG